MKGLLFGGCSFTWGQGLYFYSDLDNLPHHGLGFGFNFKEITEPMMRYKNAVRYPRLVANHFDTFEVFKDDTGILHGNGGSEDETFGFFDNIFNVQKKFRYSDFSYIIIQLSNVWRNDFIFELDDITYRTKLLDNSVDNHIKSEFKQLPEFHKYCEINGYSFSDIEKKHLYLQHKRLQEKIIFYEQKGLKVKILNWMGDFNEHYILNQQFYKGRILKLYYEDKTFTTINELMMTNEDMIIQTDLMKNYNLVCEDRHPSKLCHRVIADSIIKQII